MAVLTRIAESLERIESLLAPRVVHTVSAKGAAGAARGHRARVSARSFVRSQLVDGARPWLEILEAGKQFGHTKTTLERARKAVARSEFVDGRWQWRLREE